MLIDQLWNNLSGLGQIYWGMAIFFTIIFLIQTAFTLMGGGHDSDHDMEIEHDAGSGSDHEVSFMQYFTIRNIVAFFLGFSWGGLAALDAEWSAGSSILTGTMLGIVFVTLNLLILRGLAKLTSSGNVQLCNTVGLDGTVAISIPPERTGYGKVNVLIQGRVVEYEALTESSEIARGRTVKIVGLSGHQLIVL